METRALAHVYKLEPTLDQRAALVCLVGCRRFVYHWGVGRCRDAHAAAEKKPTYNQLAVDLTQLKRRPDRLWLAEVDSQALQQALRDLERAYGNFFAARAEWPRFARKGRDEDTARIPQRVRVNEAVGTVTIPTVGAVRLRFSRPLVGVVKSATVRRDRCGDWFVSLRLEAPALVDDPVPGDDALANGVGIDLGFATYATLFDGEAVEAVANPCHLKSGQRALKRAQRDLSRKQRGGKNREQARKRVAKRHRKVARQRADFQYKLTTALVRRHDLICLEDLNVRGMGRTNLSRSTYDAAHGEFARQVRYKAAWYGKHVVAVDRCSPSSKTCRRCGHVYAGSIRCSRRCAP